MAQNDGRLLFDTSIDMKNFSSGIDSMASIATTGLALVASAITGAGAYAIGVGASFEEGMSGVAAISGATGDELKKLEDTAKELGAKTKFSASEAAEAMTNLAAAGFNTSEIISAVPGLMNLAAASCRVEKSSLPTNEFEQSRSIIIATDCIVFLIFGFSASSSISSLACHRPVCER